MTDGPDRAYIPRGGSGRLIRKGSGYLLDQALSSGGNFAVSLVVARALGVESFGYFALAMSIWVFLLALFRAGIVQPLIVAIGEDACTTAVARGRATLLASLLGGTALIGALLGSLMAEGEFSGALAGMAFTIVPVLIHEGLRSLSLAVGEPWRAVGADVLWIMGTFALLLLLTLSTALTPGTAVLAWGGGAVLGLLPFARPRLLRFRGAGSVAWFRAHARTSAAFTAAAVSASAGAQAVVWLVAITLTPAAVGGLKAAQNLMVPGRMAATSVENFFLRRLAASSGPRVASESRLFVVIGVATVTIWLLVLIGMAGFGFAPMQTIFGASFAPFESLLVPLAIAALLACFTAAELLIIRSRLDGHSALRLAAVSTVSKVVLAAIGALVGGALGVAVGLLGAELVLFVSARRLRTRRTRPPSSWSPIEPSYG